MTARRSAIGLLWTTTFLSALSQIAKADCQASFIRYNIGTTSISQSLIVSKGEPCGHVLNPGRAGLGISGIEIAANAEHGSAAVTQSVATFGYAYMPQAGFVGKDHFSVSVQLQKAGAANTMIIDIGVDVVDKR